ncbi:hypothetical protein V8D89_002203 [Ganoderma adspersum]
MAIRRLLSIRPVRITGGKSIRRFHAFLFADVRARAPLIRTLDIDTGSPYILLPLEPGDTSLLIDILTSCQRVEHISIGCSDSIPPSLVEDPGIINAIGSIQSLRSLSFATPSVIVLNIVSNIGAPLHKLDLESCFYDGADFSWYPTAFQNSLSRQAPTLEEVVFHELIVDPEKIQKLQNYQDPQTQPFSGWTQYPAVRTLNVQYFTGRLLLGPLQHLFPGVDNTFSMDGVDLEYDIDTYDDMRAANWHAQYIEDGDDSRPRGWTFYILALRCPIRFAMIDGIDSMGGPEDDQGWLAVTLGQNPIPHLTLCLSLDDKLEVFDELFGPELAAVLTHLTLALDTIPRSRSDSPFSVRFGWDELSDNVLSSLESLHRLTHLRLVIHSESTENADTEVSESVLLTPSEGLERAVHPSMFDFQGTADLLAQRLPSLQFLLLTSCGDFVSRGNDRYAATAVVTKRWAVSRAWSVAEPDADEMQDEEPMLVELGKDEAEAITRREELILPRGCKDWFLAEVTNWHTYDTLRPWEG